MEKKERNWEKIGALGQWILGGVGILLALVLWWIDHRTKSVQSTEVVDSLPMTMQIQWVPPAMIACAIIIGALLHLKAASVAKAASVSNEPDPDKLIIHYARYGIGKNPGQYDDVTEELRGFIKNGNSIDVKLGCEIFGDPFPGHVKYTTVKYSLGGVTRVFSRPEGHRLLLSKIDTDLEIQKWKQKAEDLQRKLDRKEGPV